MRVKKTDDVSFIDTRDIELLAISEEIHKISINYKY